MQRADIAVTGQPARSKMSLHSTMHRMDAEHLHPGHPIGPDVAVKVQSPLRQLPNREAACLPLHRSHLLLITRWGHCLLLVGCCLTQQQWLVLP
jgi:hypothetical protein